MPRMYRLFALLSLMAAVGAFVIDAFLLASSSGKAKAKSRLQLQIYSAVGTPIARLLLALSCSGTDAHDTARRVKRRLDWQIAIHKSNATLIRDKNSNIFNGLSKYLKDIFLKSLERLSRYMSAKKKKMSISAAIGGYGSFYLLRYYEISSVLTAIILTAENYVSEIIYGHTGHERQMAM